MIRKFEIYVCMCFLSIPFILLLLPIIYIYIYRLLDYTYSLVLLILINQFGAGTTINHLLESRIIRVAVLIDGQTLLAPTMFSVHLVTTVQAVYRNSIVVVGNSIYLMPQ